MTIKTRGWILSRKIWILEGVRSEFCSRLTKLLLPQTKLKPNSLLTPSQLRSFLTKNSPSDWWYLGIFGLMAFQMIAVILVFMFIMVSIYGCNWIINKADPGLYWHQICTILRVNFVYWTIGLLLVNKETSVFMSDTFLFS